MLMLKPEIMKKIFLLNLILFFMLIFYSCIDRRIGQWDDNIELSAKKVEFSSLGDSVTIHTGGSSWRISDIAVDGKYFYGFTGVDFQADSYSIKQDCFVVKRLNKNSLFIKVAANPNTVKRIIIVGLEAGDYFDRVTITQKPN